MKKKLAVLLGLIFCLCLLNSCKFMTTSPDGRYQCIKSTRDGPNPTYKDDPGASWVIREVKTQKIVLKTWGKYYTPNDVKAMAWSDDSKKFAAFYHYGETAETGYTWVGVWALENGERIYTREVPGWVHWIDGEEDFPLPPSHGKN